MHSEQTYEEVDENGEPRRVAGTVGDARRAGPPASGRVVGRVDLHVGPQAVRERVWHQNPGCVECGAIIPAVMDAALVQLPDGLRVACKRDCFVRAVARTNPTFSSYVARGRA